MSKKEGSLFCEPLSYSYFLSLCRILAQQINLCQSPKGTWVSILGELLRWVGSEQAASGFNFNQRDLGHSLEALAKDVCAGFFNDFLRRNVCHCADIGPPTDNATALIADDRSLVLEVGDRERVASAVLAPHHAYWLAGF
jgi:hypothetical protein